MADEAKKDDVEVKQPWEELGYSSFSEYSAAMDKKIADLAAATKELQEKANKKPEDKPAEKPEAKDDKPTDADWEKKAAIVYAGMSEADQKKVEEVFKALPADVQELASSSSEAKYMILKEFNPVAESSEDGSFFGSLKPKAPKKSPSDMIKEAMASLRGPASPERKGSGFMPMKPSAKPDVGVHVPKSGILSGLYK